MIGQIWERTWGLIVGTPSLKRWVVRQWYEYFSTLDREGVIPLMNYGYADDTTLALLPGDEPNRYGIQMYQHVASQVDLRGLDVLEVGSGRGGGASYVMRYLNPRTYTGVELATGNVLFSKRQHRVPGLTFWQGDAEQIRCNDSVFDVVLNIESSTHYGDIEQFFREVKRVLKPGGYFLYADTWQPHELDALYRQFERADLSCLRVEDMTPHVVRAMNEDAARRKQLIKTHISPLLRGMFQQFSGTPGSQKYEMFASGKVHYLCCLLQNSNTRTGLYASVATPEALVMAEESILELA